MIFLGLVFLRKKRKGLVVYWFSSLPSYGLSEPLNNIIWFDAQNKTDVFTMFLW